MNKKDVKEIKDLEQYYSKARKIKFSEELEKKYENLSLFKIFYLFLHKKNETYYVRGKLQCKAYKYRSMDELFVICKYYFPEITIKEILQKVIDLSIYFKNKDILIPIMLYCPDIRKLNFRGPSFYYDNYSNRSLKTNNNFDNLPYSAKVLDILK